MTHTAGPTSARPAILAVTRSRWRSLTAGLLVGAAMLVAVSWWVTHPAELPVRDGHVTAVTSPGRPVYVGLLAGAHTDRTLRVGGVHLHTDATVPVEVVPLLCRGGSVSVTSDADTFCAELLDPDGQQLRPGDSIVVRVAGDEPGAAFIARMRLTYRSGLQVATQPAGTSAVVAIVPPSP